MLILITSLSAFVVVVLLLAAAVLKRSGGAAKTGLGDVFSKEVEITETSTYHETKQQMVILKTAVDSFLDSANELVQKQQRQSYIGLTPLLSEDLTFMHDDLTDAHLAAEKVLCVIEQRPFEARQISVSPPKNSENDEVISTSGTRVLQLMSSLVDTMEEVGPLIAGFYLSLTLPSEKKRVSQAATYARTVVGCLNDASRKMKAIDQEIEAETN
jgi:hypothetical protein